MGLFRRGTSVVQSEVRDGIISKLSRQWLTPQQALQRKPRAPRHAETLHRFIGVARAGGHEAATSADQHRQIRFVKSQCHQRQTHAKVLRQAAHALGISRSKSVVTAANSAFATTLFGCMTMS